MPKYAMCSFAQDSKKVYSYEIVDGVEVEVGDLVVVETDLINSANYSSAYNTVVVTSIEDESPYNGKHKKVVGKVQYEAYQTFLDNEHKKAKINKKLAKMKKEMEERAIWDVLAQTNPEAAALLSELDEINGVKPKAEPVEQVAEAPAKAPARIGRKPISDDVISVARSMVDRGMKVPEVAERLSVGASTLYKRLATSK